MKEITFDNLLNLKIHVNGTPDLTSIPAEQLDIFISTLEKTISENDENPPER